MASTNSTTSQQVPPPSPFTDSDRSARSLSTSASLTSLVGAVRALKTDDVDEIKLNTMRLWIGSKCWQGHKSLGRDLGHFARFRSLMELFLSENAVSPGSLESLPSFPLVAAFSIRGIHVLASAEPRSDKFNVIPVDKRDLSNLTMALKSTKMLVHFPYQDFPQLWVRQIPGRKETTLVRVTTRYDDVLCHSLRSKMVVGVLVRAKPAEGQDAMEFLSTVDLRELVQDRVPLSIPYLNLLCYQVDTPAESSVENHAAQSFLLKSSQEMDIPLTGNVVIAVDEENGRVPLHLMDAFVMKRQIEVHPLVRRLQELKKNNAVLNLMTTNMTMNGTNVHDAGLGVAAEYEKALKLLLVRHVKEFASQLVTLGDVPATANVNFSAIRSQSLSGPLNRLARSNTMAPVPRSKELFSVASFSSGDRDRSSPVRPGIRRRRSSLAVAANVEEATDNRGTYVMDTLHLRQVMRDEGVNMCLLPLVFRHLNAHRQHGMRIIVATEIIVRIAKTLFQYQMVSDTSKIQQQWKSRKARTIRYIDSIIHGLFHDDLLGGVCPIRECSGDQFWKVDGPIFHALGTFAGSFPLDPQLFNETKSLEAYRQLLKANPALLATSLLRMFGARLAASVLPELHENRFLTVPFLRSESDLIFDNEAGQQEFGVTTHPEMLWSTLQFFQIQFDRVNTSSMSKADNGSWLHYYLSQARLLRQTLMVEQPMSLEHSLLKWEEQTSVRALLGHAIRAASAPSSPEQQVAVSENCRAARAILSVSKLPFPIEFKIALHCLDLMCTEDKLPVALANSHGLLAFLRFFYRPANLAQFAKYASSHPVYSLQFVDECGRVTPTSGSSESMRSRLRKEQGRKLWVDIMPAVDAYCRRVEVKRKDPVAAAALKAVLAGTRHRNTEGTIDGIVDDRHSSGSNNKSSSISDRYDSSSSMESDSSKSAKVYNSFGDGGHSLTVVSGSARSSSRVDALWFIESFLLPPMRGATSAWLLPGSLLMKIDGSLARRNEKIPINEPDTSVPGAAFLWGKPFGLSLDEEAQHSSSLPRNEQGQHENGHKAANDESIALVRVPGPLRRVVHVSCGYRHTALVTHDRRLYTFGYGECGRLGHGTEESRHEPTLVTYFSSLIDSIGVDEGGVASVSCGREHTMVVLANGDLFGFGWAEAGRLGTGETESSLYPSRVARLQGQTRDVACGREHTLALTRTGQVYAFGAGFGGRLGNGSEKDAELPIQVQCLDEVTIAQIDAGECHSCAVSDKGEVFTWGFGASGALGHGTRDNCLVPTKVFGPWIQADTRGSDEANATSVASIACGSYHTLVSTTGGALYGWGDAAAGQLGDEHLDVEDMVVLTPQKIRLPGRTTSSGIRQITCGTFTSALCTQDGKLYTWGSPEAGNGAKLNVDDARVRRVEDLADFSIAHVACGAYHTVALTRKLEYY